MFYQTNLDKNYKLINKHNFLLFLWKLQRIDIHYGNQFIANIISYLSAKKRIFENKIIYLDEKEFTHKGNGKITYFITPNYVDFKKDSIEIQINYKVIELRPYIELGFISEDKESQLLCHYSNLHLEETRYCNGKEIRITRGFGSNSRLMNNESGDTYKMAIENNKLTIYFNDMIVRHHWTEKILLKDVDLDNIVNKNKKYNFCITSCIWETKEGHIKKQQDKNKYIYTTKYQYIKPDTESDTDSDTYTFTDSDTDT